MPYWGSGGEGLKVKYNPESLWKIVLKNSKKKKPESFSLEGHSGRAKHWWCIMGQMKI
jgi:hypothetical protein